MKRKLGDRVSYAEIHREFPALLYLGDIPRSNIPHKHADSYATAMRVLRIGACWDSFLVWKDWLKITDELGLRSSVPSAVIRKHQRDTQASHTHIVSHVYESPFPGKDNPCPKIHFQKPKVRVY